MIQSMKKIISIYLFICLGFQHKMAQYAFILVSGDINAIILKRIFLLELVGCIWVIKFGKVK